MQLPALVPAADPAVAAPIAADISTGPLTPAPSHGDTPGALLPVEHCVDILREFPAGRDLLAVWGTDAASHIATAQAEAHTLLTAIAGNHPEAARGLMDAYTYMPMDEQCAVMRALAERAQRSSAPASTAQMSVARARALDREIDRLQTAKFDAQSRGDWRLANELHEEQHAALARRHGNGPIVNGARTS